MAIFLYNDGNKGVIMDEKELKTSPKQRVFIILIAVIMVGSIIASYAAIVLSGNNGSATDANTEIDQEKVAKYSAEYQEKVAKLEEETKADFDKFIQYKSEIKAYNENTANEEGLKSRDLKEGTGDVVTGDNYLAFYVGWCADETVFDSSFDNSDEPTAFSKVLDPSLGMIEGWSKGVEGMKIGGIRKITVPGELAYGDSMEICGGENKPLKFIVMAVENKDPLKTTAKELDEAYMRYQYAMYGMDYDEVMNSQE